MPHAFAPPTQSVGDPTRCVQRRAARARHTLQATHARTDRATRTRTHTTHAHARTADHTGARARTPRATHSSRTVAAPSGEVDGMATRRLGDYPLELLHPR
eukprot:2609767-Prymnesium_polylepis.1